MSTVRAQLDGFVGYTGGELRLHYGDVFSTDHPLVKERPDLFSAQGKASAPAPEPEPEQSEGDVLRTLLAEAGVKVDNRWGVERLKQELDKATK